MALLAQHAEAVGVIDNDPGVMALGQFQQLAQRRDIAVHAEHAVGHDQLALAGAGRQQRFQRGGVAMRVALHVGAREPRPIDQRGMVERLAEQRGARGAQRGQHRHVGHVAGAEIQRARMRDMRGEPARQFRFQLGVRQRMPADQVRGTAARTIALRAFHQRGDHVGVVGQPHVVVAAEGQQRIGLGLFHFADCLVRCARGVRDAAAARQRLRVALLGGVFQLFKQHGAPPRSQA
ncbi:hypothetical protein D3C72_1620790 [compost metagenome]